MKKHLFVKTILIITYGLSFVACTAQTYGNPPHDTQISDIVGIWEVKYGKTRIDQLVIREDGLYQQRYEDKVTGYLFETDWQPVELEERTDGSIYVHFDNARYYAAGVEIGELDGLGSPCPSELPDCFSENNPHPFYDPYSNSHIEMEKELILTLRVDGDKLVLHHLWTYSDRGFVIIGGEEEIFRRINDDKVLER